MKIEDVIIDPEGKPRFSWYRAFVLLLSGVAAIGVVTLGLWVKTKEQWLSANYVSITENKAEWDRQITKNASALEKQVEINLKISGQLSELIASFKGKDIVDESQWRMLNSLEQDVREQRNLLQKR